MLVELYTYKENGKSFSRKHASQAAYADLSRAASAVRLVRLGIDPIRFEIEQGQPASKAPVSMLAISQRSPMPSCEELKDMWEREEVMKHLLDFKHPLKCEEVFRALRALQSIKERWSYMSDFFGYDSITSSIRDETIAFFKDMAVHRGWVVSRNFCPDRHWFTFRRLLVEYAYFTWKYIWYGDGIPEARKPANPLYDMIYVTYMAICDGLLSCDKTMLNIAWCCWPEKHNDIFTYDQVNAKKIIPYVPEWL